jgi:hypothetical protein
MTVETPIRGRPINLCAFGALEIGGKRFSSDLFLFPDGRVRDQWWRRSGHRLSIDDMAPLLEAVPRIVIVGTGYYGRMVPDRDLESRLGRLGIDLETAPTCAAAQRFNDAFGKAAGVAGCFHLTC